MSMSLHGMTLLQQEARRTGSALLEPPLLRLAEDPRYSHQEGMPVCNALFLRSSAEWMLDACVQLLLDRIIWSLTAEQHRIAEGRSDQVKADPSENGGHHSSDDGHDSKRQVHAATLQLEELACCLQGKCRPGLSLAWSLFAASAQSICTSITQMAAACCLEMPTVEKHPAWISMQP